LLAIDADGDVLSFNATGLPAGVSLDRATGIISGVPNSTGTSVNQVTLTVTDGALSDTESFTWTVERVNQSPTLASPTDLTSAEGESISVLLSAQDPDGDAITYSATGLPASVRLDSRSGLVSGTLSFTSAGEYAVQVTVSDGRLSSSRTFQWIVMNTNRSPALVNPGAQTHYARGEYAKAVMRDRPTAYWRLGDSSGSIAEDIVDAHHGTRMGTVAPAQAGALTESDGAMLFDGSTNYIHVAGAAALPLAGDLTIELWVKVSLTSRQTLISKDFLREFELTLETNGELNFYQGNGTASGNVRSVSGAVKPHIWQHVVVTRSAATNAIAFYVNGTAKGAGIAAAAAAPGNAPISIGRAKNGSRYTNGSLDEVAIYPVVLTTDQVAAHHAMSTTTTVEEITLQLSANDPDGDAMVYSAAGLPAGLALHPQNGRISGKVSPSSAGTYQVTVTAADQTSSVSQTFTWTVKK
jgi:PKD repeat protein